VSIPESPVRLPELLYFQDLVELRLVQNWTTLNRWIRDLGFPPGRMVGRCRLWTRASVFAWIESQPTANTAPLKGFAKTVKAQRDKGGR
jgi:hypothetical protein